MKRIVCLVLALWMAVASAEAAEETWVSNRYDGEELSVYVLGLFDDGTACFSWVDWVGGEQVTDISAGGVWRRLDSGGIRVYLGSGFEIELNDTEDEFCVGELYLNGEYCYMRLFQHVFNGIGLIQN